MEIQNFFKKCKFNWTNTYAASGGDAWLSHDYEVNPEKFLGFAEKDLKQGDEHGLINSITNAKRAVDCQTDKILCCFGYDPTERLPSNATAFIDRFQEENGIIEATQNLKLLHALDIVPSGLVSEMRRVRHNLEHRYECPLKKNVRDFVDLAKLFIRSTEYVLKLFPEYWSLVDTKTPQLKTNIIRIEYPHGEKRFVLSLLSMKKIDDDELQNGLRSQLVDKISVDSNTPLFLPLVEINVVSAVDGYLQPSLASLVSIISSQIPRNKVRFIGYIDEPL